MLRREAWACCPFHPYRDPLPSGLFWTDRTLLYSFCSWQKDLYELKKTKITYMVQRSFPLLKFLVIFAKTNWISKSDFS